MTDVTFNQNLVPARDIVKFRAGWSSDTKVSVLRLREQHF
jgi:hypothetical protein